MSATSRCRWLVVPLALSVLSVGAPAFGQGAELAPPPTATVTGPPPTTWPEPPGEQLTASSWVLVEAATGQRLAEHNADEPRPVASTIKLLTALTAISRVDLDDTVTVGDEVLVGGASVGLEPGETWTVRDLLEAVLVRSGNDATEALATHVAGDSAAFVALMRADARALGIEPAALGSPSGLGDENLLTALDLATVARAALAEPRLRPLFALEEVELPGDEPAENRNLLLGTYPGATGLKTGFTLAAGNSLVASAERGGRELVAVVLDAGDDPARFEQAAALLDHGFEQFATRSVSAELELAVAGGWRSFVSPQLALTTPAERIPVVEFEVPVRVPEGELPAAVTIDGDALAPTVLVPEPAGTSAPDASAAGRLGAAVVDGVYASLRAAASSAGTLR